jgi:hypothetical protein
MTSYYEVDCPHSKECSDVNSYKCHCCKHNKKKSYYEPVVPYPIPYTPITPNTPFPSYPVVWCAVE